MRLLNLLALGFFLLWAQEETTPSESKPSSPSKSIRLRTNFYAEVGYNRLNGLPGDLATTTKGLGSIKINLQPLYLLHIKKTFYVGAGVGWAIREVRFEKNVLLHKDSTGFLSYTIDTASAVSGFSAKSKFQLHYARIPLEIGILRKDFQLAVNGYVDFLIAVRQKRKLTDGEQTIKEIRGSNKNFGTDALQYGIGARLGYKGIGLFVNYNLSTLWRSNKGPDNVQAFQAGLYFYSPLYKKAQKSVKGSSYNS